VSGEKKEKGANQTLHSGGETKTPRVGTGKGKQVGRQTELQTEEIVGPRKKRGRTGGRKSKKKKNDKGSRGEPTRGGRSRTPTRGDPGVEALGDRESTKSSEVQL